MKGDADRLLLDAAGPAAPPRANGELVFEAPWQSRLFGVTLALVEQGAFAFEEFRALLIDEIGRSDRAGAATPYYSSWALALERVLARKSLLTSAALDAREQSYALRPAGHDHDHASC